MLALFVFLRILRRALWLIPVGFLFGFGDVLNRTLSTPALDAIEEFLLGPRIPVPFLFSFVFPPVFYFFGILWYAEKYVFLLSPRAFDSRVIKNDDWKSCVTIIENEIEAGELVFPSFAESRSMTPQEYMTRMFVAKTHWNDPELRKRQPKLRDSIFKI